MKSNDNAALSVIDRAESRANFLVFRNKGVINLRAVTTFGISAKDPANSNPIGYFGTGLKYAIAVLVRHGIPISIHAGSEKYEFAFKEEFVREKAFKIVTINGEPMSFTTDLGKNWELWQAFRELYSNCVDEFGQSSSEIDAPEPMVGMTHIVVESEKMIELFENRREIFLEGQPIAETSVAAIHGGESNNVFYRGIKIASVKNPLMYRYNIKKHMDLTEDRTLAYSWQINDSIVDAVMQSNDPKFIESILTAPESAHEHSLNFLDNRAEMSDAFKSVVSELRRNKPEKTNKAALELFDRNLPAQARFEIYKPNQAEQSQYIRAVDFLTALGYPIDKFKVVFVVNLGESTMAYVEAGAMYLSSVLFDKGTKYLAATIFEEYVHLQYGFEDCSRGMQNFLFEKFISLAETMKGETL